MSSSSTHDDVVRTAWLAVLLQTKPTQHHPCLTESQLCIMSCIKRQIIPPYIIHSVHPLTNVSDFLYFKVLFKKKKKIDSCLHNRQLAFVNILSTGLPCCVATLQRGPMFTPTQVQRVTWEQILNENHSCLFKPAMSARRLTPQCFHLVFEFLQQKQHISHTPSS